MSTLLFIIVVCLFALREFSLQTNWKRATGADRRASFERALLEANTNIDRMVAIRQHIEEPETRKELKYRTMSERAFVGMLRNEYQHYGLDLEAERLWDQYLAQKRRFDIVDEKGNVIYFGEGDKS